MFARSDIAVFARSCRNMSTRRFLRGLSSGAGNGAGRGVWRLHCNERCLRVKVSPLPHPSPRAFLQAHALIHENGALVLVATGHLTAGSDKTEERSIELQSILRKLEATKGMDACIFAGDVNMRCDEVWSQGIIVLVGEMHGSRMEAPNKCQVHGALTQCHW